MAADLSDYDAETISCIPASKIAVFIMSTFGEGDPSDNAGDFWRYLNAKSIEEKLTNLNYAAIGLGNTNYQHYNRVIDVVTSTIDRLGATAILPTARVDDAEGTTEAQFIEWRESLLATLQRRLNLEGREPVFLPSIKVEVDDSLDIMDLHLGTPVQRCAANSSALVPLPVERSHELFTNSTRNCLHLDLDLSEVAGLSYKTGDHLAVWPVNPNDEVDRILDVLGFSGRRTAPISTKSLDSAVKIHIPTPTTIEAMFRHYLEICGPVSRDTIQALVQFSPSPTIAEFLKGLAGDDATYAEFSQTHCITLGRLLELSAQKGELGEATWKDLPLSFVVESLRPLQHRLYSISSSSVISPKSLSITALVVNTPLPGSDQSINGVTSNYLLSASRLRNSSAPAETLPHVITQDPMPRLYASVRKSTFRPPPSTSNMIMVSAGTGVAPFRGFLLERARLHAMARSVGRTVLFFGCRSPEEDHIYKDELEATASSLPGASIVPVYSRVSYEGKPGRGYVQDVVKDQEEDVTSMILDQGARVYVCGRAAMSREVAKVLKNAVAARKGWDESERDEWWASWRRQGSFLEDVWG